MPSFCCQSFHIWAESSALILQPRRGAAPCSGPCPFWIFIFPLFFFLFFYVFYFMSQLWKGLEHILMQFCQSAVYLSYLFSEVLLFTELCSNSSRIIYYDENLIVNRVVFQIVPRPLSSFHPRPSVLFHLSSTACGLLMDAGENRSFPPVWRGVNKISRLVVEIFENVAGS